MKLLNLLFNRPRVDVERRKFRFSSARSEAARYRVDFSGYQPIELPGDPVVDERLPRREARLLFDGLCAIASARRTMLTEYLAGFGLTPGTRSEDWQQIERWLDEIIEPSAEPADRQWPRLRPMAEAFLLDLALAFAEAARVHHAANVRIGFHGDTLDHSVGLCEGFPVLVDLDGRFRFSPRGTFLFLGTRAANTSMGERTVLASAWHALGPPHVGETSAERPEDLKRWVEAHEAATGTLPSLGELADYAVENRIAEEQVPRDLIERLSRGR